MQRGTITTLQMPQMCAFDLQIKYSETDRKSHRHEIELHSHDRFELYINLAGDVSFLVENTLYPLSRGDVILARPGEQHHCIYRSDAPHKLYWILFDCKQNATLFDALQADFSENYISPDADRKEELIALCRLLHSGRITKEEKIYSFFRLFAILKASRTTQPPAGADMPQALREIMDFIDRHIAEDLTVGSIAKGLYISQRTVERRFRDYLDITPLEWIRKKRLFLAAERLQRGESVLTVSLQVGYHDTSYFIELFKR